jgi:hypothetical protein
MHILYQISVAMQLTKSEQCMSSISLVINLSSDFSPRVQTTHIKSLYRPVKAFNALSWATIEKDFG